MLILSNYSNISIFYDLDDSYWYVYKIGHSNDTALVSTENGVHLSLSKGEPTALVLQAFSTAFDTTDHYSQLPSDLVLCLGLCFKWFTSI